jgi:hypothetical protein
MSWSFTTIPVLVTAQLPKVSLSKIIKVRAATILSSIMHSNRRIVFEDWGERRLLCRMMTVNFIMFQKGCKPDKLFGMEAASRIIKVVANLHWEVTV